MDKDKIVHFLSCVGVGSGSLQITQEWVRAPCVLAPWTHDSGKDSHPSFAVKVAPNGESHYNCFTCGTGDLYGLILELSKHKAPSPKYNLRGALDILAMEMEEGVTQSLVDWQEGKEVYKEIVWPEDWLASFMFAYTVPEAMAYLKSRGVDSTLAAALGLRWDSSRKTVCFPVRNWEGKLVGMRGRYIYPNESGVRFHLYKYHGEHSKLVWYGEDTVDVTKEVVLVESVFDYASVYRVYKNILAPLSVGMSKDKVSRISGALYITTLFDRGKGGDTARKQVSKYLTDAVIVHKLPPEGCSDPGDMNEDEIREALSEILSIPGSA